jgi:hypothetical protein
MRISLKSQSDNDDERHCLLAFERFLFYVEAASIAHIEAVML